MDLRRRAAHALEREQPREVGLREDLEVAVAPAEPRDVVQHRFGREAAVAVALHRHRFLSLRQLLPARLDEQRHVREQRRLPAHALVDEELARRAGHVLAAADHVRDAHVVVVDDDGEVVDRRAVGPRDHEVVELRRVLAGRTRDQIVPARVAAGVGHAQPQAERQRTVGPDLLVAAGAVVAGLLAARLGALAHRVDLGLGAGAAVRVSACDELRDRLAVAGVALRLARNARRSRAPDPSPCPPTRAPRARASRTPGSSARGRCPRSGAGTRRPRGARTPS